MDIQTLVKRNRLPRKQKGQRIETETAFCLRYYKDGKQNFTTLAHKGGLYRSWSDVEPLIQNILADVNDGRTVISPQQTLTDFVEKVYLPWCRENKAAPTANGYTRVWERHWKQTVGSTALAKLETSDVTAVLTHLAKSLGSRSLSHAKWMLSGVYQCAIASGIVPKNPVPDAKWLVKVRRPAKQREYSLQEIQSMLAILEPLDLRAAVAVALCYFAALRPAEDWHEPVLGLEVQRRLAGVGHVANIVEQVIPNTDHGVHTRTPRKPAVAQAARKSSSFARLSGPSAGSWNITSPCVSAKGTTKCHCNIGP